MKIRYALSIVLVVVIFNKETFLNNSVKIDSF